MTLQTTHVLGLDSEVGFGRALACLAFSKVASGDLLAVIDESKEHILSLWEWHNRKKLVEAKVLNSF